MNGYEQFLKYASALLVLTSPVGVFLHYISQASRDVYPPEADSIGIPIFGYAFFVFPFLVAIWLYSLKGKDHRLRVTIWTSGKQLRAIVSLLVCIPPGLSWFSILYESHVTFAIPSLLYSAVMLYVILLLRSRILLYPGYFFRRNSDKTIVSITDQETSVVTEYKKNN